MSRRITFKLSGEKAEAALKFAADLDMDLNMAAERALLWAIRQAYTTYAENQSDSDSQGDTLRPHPEGLPGSGSALEESGPVADTQV